MARPPREPTFNLHKIMEEITPEQVEEVDEENLITLDLVDEYYSDLLLDLDDIHNGRSPRYDETNARVPPLLSNFTGQVVCKLIATKRYDNHLSDQELRDDTRKLLKCALHILTDEQVELLMAEWIETDDGHG